MDSNPSKSTKSFKFKPFLKQKPSLSIRMKVLVDFADFSAEEEGFEPPDPVKGLRFSRPVQ